MAKNEGYPLGFVIYMITRGGKGLVHDITPFIDSQIEAIVTNRTGFNDGGESRFNKEPINPQDPIVSMENLEKRVGSSRYLMVSPGDIDKNIWAVRDALLSSLPLVEY